MGGFRVKPSSLVTVIIGLLITTTVAIATAIPVGAAPKGDATAVASRIIKENFPNCKRVTSAVRSTDGSIRAVCDGTKYLVFTVFNTKEGKVIELALNCTAAKKMDVAC
jgi:hypothetical protein